MIQVARESSSEEDPPRNDGEFIQPEDLLNPEAAAHGIRDGKNARKRRKKAIMAAQAAAKVSKALWDSSSDKDQPENVCEFIQPKDLFYPEAAAH